MKYTSKATQESNSEFDISNIINLFRKQKGVKKYI